MHKDAPFFSVIIPTLNRAEKLRRALISLEKQSFQDFEVIVCDDGSTDHTERVVEEFKKKIPVRYIKDNKLAGPAHPRNRGLAIAGGEWVCFLDDDDWWYPGKLGSIRKVTDEADFIYHDLDIFTFRRKSLRKEKGRKPSLPFFNDLLKRGNCIKNSSSCIRRSLLKKAGGFNEDSRLIGVEDYDLWLRISRVTERFLYIPKSLGAYWKDQENISGRFEKHIERIKEVYSRHLDHLLGSEKTEARICRDYIIAKMKKNMGSYDEALSLFKSSMGAKDLEIKLKSTYLFLLVYFRNKLSWREG
ncbi:glycosyltransferase [bacterium]|nr:MAG: glycosyltransferase [bacterium]